jgi:hypothetical protein
VVGESCLRLRNGGFGFSHFSGHQTAIFGHHRAFPGHFNPVFSRDGLFCPGFCTIRNRNRL